MKAPKQYKGKDDTFRIGRNSAAAPRKNALEGLRGSDFSHALAGPYCTLLLAEYGAEVYKLEAPGSGELSRGWGPPFAGGQASFFLGLNRGKRGISIDLKRPEGIALCLDLLDHMDVIVENFRPSTMDRLGLGYDAVPNGTLARFTVRFPDMDKAGLPETKPRWIWLSSVPADL